MKISTILHGLYKGNTWHVRHLPTQYSFRYAYRFWGLNLDVPHTITNSRWFSVDGRLALNQFLVKDHAALVALCQTDDNGESKATVQSVVQDLPAFSQLIKRKLESLTGKPVLGALLALTNARTLGLYFSPVNFYIGHDATGTPSHLLAEVSNTPWGETHLYGFLLDGAQTQYSHDKVFKVSPFNDVAGERYTWKVEVDGKQVRISIALNDARGRVFGAGVDLTAVPLTKKNVRQAVLTNPATNLTSLGRIYWHALKLYALKKVPYVPYRKA